MQKPATRIEVISLVGASLGLCGGRHAALLPYHHGQSFGGICKSVQYAHMYGRSDAHGRGNRAASDKQL